jgi:hypothetical protein
VYYNCLVKFLSIWVFEFNIVKTVELECVNLKT